MANDIIKSDSTSNVVYVGPAIKPSASRTKELVANPTAYVSDVIKAIEADMENYDRLVKSDVDRLTDEEKRVSAGDEYLRLLKAQDYIKFRMDEIKATFFNTLDERESIDPEESPEWALEAPAKFTPGEVEIEEVGIKFQRAVGSPKGESVNEKTLAKAHPRIYKSFIKEKILPAVEEQKIEFFDKEAFVEKYKNNPKFKDFIETQYGTVSFRVHNTYDS